MLFGTIITSTIALAMGVSAAPAADSRDGQLRIFSEAGCGAGNLGEIGVYDDTFNTCQTFGDIGGAIVNSVEFEQKAVNNCTLAVFNDEFCDEPSYPVDIHQCTDGPSFASFKLSCPFA